MAIKKIIFILALLLIPSHALAFPARVVAVADGDTITVEPVEGGDRIKIRLYGIDCPEGNQPFGSIAKDFVVKLTLHKVVDIAVKDKDRYGRTVAIVKLNGDILQELLLENGLAWVSANSCCVS